MYNQNKTKQNSEVWDFHQNDDWFSPDFDENARICILNSYKEDDNQIDDNLNTFWKISDIIENLNTHNNFDALYQQNDQNNNDPIPNTSNINTITQSIDKSSMNQLQNPFKLNANNDSLKKQNSFYQEQIKTQISDISGFNKQIPAKEQLNTLPLANKENNKTEMQSNNQFISNKENNQTETQVNNCFIVNKEQNQNKLNNNSDISPSPRQINNNQEKIINQLANIDEQLQPINIIGQEKSHSTVNSSNICSLKEKSINHQDQANAQLNKENLNNSKNEFQNNPKQMISLGSSSISQNSKYPSKSPEICKNDLTSKNKDKIEQNIHISNLGNKTNIFFQDQLHETKQNNLASNSLQNINKVRTENNYDEQISNQPANNLNNSTEKPLSEKTISPNSTINQMKQQQKSTPVISNLNHTKQSNIKDFFQQNVIAHDKANEQLAKNVQYSSTADSQTKNDIHPQQTPQNSSSQIISEEISQIPKSNDNQTKQNFTHISNQQQIIDHSKTAQATKINTIQVSETQKTHSDQLIVLQNPQNSNEEITESKQKSKYNLKPLPTIPAIGRFLTEASPLQTAIRHKHVTNSDKQSTMKDEKDKNELITPVLPLFI